MKELWEYVISSKWYACLTGVTDKHRASQSGSCPTGRTTATLYPSLYHSLLSVCLYLFFRHCCPPLFSVSTASSCSSTFLSICPLTSLSPCMFLSLPQLHVYKPYVHYNSPAAAATIHPPTHTHYIQTLSG